MGELTLAYTNLLLYDAYSLSCEQQLQMNLDAFLTQSAA